MQKNRSFLLIHRTQQPTIPPHADHFEIHPEAGSSIGIDDIRKLREWAFLKPFSKENKVALLASAHTATQEAQNALLKLLEEPPEQTYLFVHVNDSENVLPTILSRCQVLQSFDSLPVEIDWESPESSVVKEEHRRIFSPEVLTNRQLSIKDLFDTAQALSKLDRYVLVQFIDETIQSLHINFKNDYGLTPTLEALIEAKKLLQQNCNVQLTMENLLLTIFSDGQEPLIPE